MVSLAEIRHLRKCFVLFGNTRVKTCVTIKPVVKILLRPIYPIQLIVVLDVEKWDIKKISTVTVVGIKILGADRWMTGKNKSKYRHIDILTYEQEIADQENHFLMVVHPRRNLQE